MCLALPSGAVAQQPGANDAPLPAAADSESAPPPAAQNPAEPQAPPEKQTLAVRVRRLLDDFNQRHEQRMQEISSYDKAGDSEPGLKQLADPRKVELELKDERDRERTSEALANLYAEEAGQVKSQEQAVEEFLAKRHKSLDDLSKRTSKINRQDLELAAENLARQPGTEAQVREIRSRLAEADRNDKELSAQRPQIQLEIAGAEEELKKVRALEQSLGEQSKAYAADAASARQNQLSLADRLEFYLVRAKAEDVLDEDREATQTVQHLSTSPEVRDTLSSPAPKAKPGAKPDTPKECDDKSSDGKGCAETTAQAPKE
jgi:chromosome segregation ATPase